MLRAAMHRPEIIIHDRQKKQKQDVKSKYDRINAKINDPQMKNANRRSEM
jgi:hypothetical protein